MYLVKQKPIKARVEGIFLRSVINFGYIYLIRKRNVVNISGWYNNICLLTILLNLQHNFK